jgi:hypothetical protein
LFDVLVLGNLLLPAVLSWAGGYCGSVIFHLLCGAGHVIVGGVLGWESMASALCNLGLGLGLSKFLILPQPVTIIHLSFLFSPSSGILVHHQSSPDLLPSFSYSPNSAENLWLGLNATSSSPQIDLKQ